MTLAQMGDKAMLSIICEIMPAYEDFKVRTPPTIPPLLSCAFVPECPLSFLVLPHAMDSGPRIVTHGETYLSWFDTDLFFS